jgi:hypothetical protein
MQSQRLVATVYISSFPARRPYSSSRTLCGQSQKRPLRDFLRRRRSTLCLCMQKLPGNKELGAFFRMPLVASFRGRDLGFLPGAGPVEDPPAPPEQAVVEAALRERRLHSHRQDAGARDLAPARAVEDAEAFVQEQVRVPHDIVRLGDQQAAGHGAAVPRHEGVEIGPRDQQGAGHRAAPRARRRSRRPGGEPGTPSTGAEQARGWSPAGTNPPTPPAVHVRPVLVHPLWRDEGAVADDGHRHAQFGAGRPAELTEQVRVQERLSPGKVDLLPPGPPEQAEAGPRLLERELVRVLLRVEAELAPVVARPRDEVVHRAHPFRHRDMLTLLPTACIN